MKEKLKSQILVTSKFVDKQTKSHNSIFGILPYIAPELLSAKQKPNEPFPYSKASDIYSLGVLFWEIVNCKIPFENHPYGISRNL
ncbi:kinase-like domain-containing protein [Rhizophagus clarus]|uniref:Kinase-like domain-containing protein n=1 Tax=Rhizophagus clarus TaxID=94130 RepID=A0A8H3QW23_9GLOM|nr:kinase-like domain-containing protein [Rhizophagus clarus]